ncbi:unnamed protein product, partial [Meganyctiphanes norvegica]
QEDRALALWTSDSIDLSRTADLGGGYRGVYLGKLRQGSSYGRAIPIQVEKGYTLLPNKYGNSNAPGGLGSARGDRNGSRSPLLNSPSMHRRITNLAPLGQVSPTAAAGGYESGGGGGVGSVHRVIPPLSAVSRRSTHAVQRSTSNSEDLEEDEEESQSEYEYNEKDEDEIEEEVAEDERSRPMSSATTRDSGISVFSNNEGERNGSEMPQHLQQSRDSVISRRSIVGAQIEPNVNSSEEEESEVESEHDDVNDDEHDDDDDPEIVVESRETERSITAKGSASTIHSRRSTASSMHSHQSDISEE